MNIHFISIGGSVMHQLAIALHNKGYKITGSDDEIFEPSKSNLQAAGLLPKETGWFESNMHEGLDAVILGMHARADNPELIKAKALQLPVYSFPEYIYEESKNKTRVVVGGSHGKTTTTSMIMHVLQQTGNNFDFLVGAKLPGFKQSVHVSNAPVIICEGDEYPASALERRPKFHFLFPQVAIITGIAWDHINVFPTFEIYLEQFRIFIAKIEAGGILIYNAADEELNSLVNENRRNDIRYQPYAVPVYKIENGLTNVQWNDSATTLKVFGEHNLLNMEAARYACAELGVSTASFAPAISTFTGASKRLEVLAENETTAVFRDFAHAPSKVKATIQAVKQQYPERTLIALLELHTYSSLNAQFMPHYAHALDAAQVACVYYSNHALEIKKMPPLSQEDVQKGFAHPQLSVINKPEELLAWMQQLKVHNASVLLMSSGNFEGLDISDIFTELMQQH